MRFTTHSVYVPDADAPEHGETGIAAFAFADRQEVPLVVTSHAPYKRDLFAGRLVLVLRDPRDVLVSQYHYLTKHRKFTSCEFEEYLHGNNALAALGIPSAVHAISRYLDSWVAPILDGRATVAQYELWHTSPEEGLKHLLATVNLPIDDELVVTACTRSSVMNMRQAEAEQPRASGPGPEAPAVTDMGPEDPDSQFVRIARPGGWRAGLNRAEAAELCRLLDRQITRRTKRMFRQLVRPYEVADDHGPYEH